MVSKKCVICGSYFAGELDGDYTCPRCQAAGPLRYAAGGRAAAAPPAAPDAPPEPGKQRSSSQAA